VRNYSKLAEKMVFDTKDLKVGSRFSVVLEVVEEHDSQEERSAILINYPGMLIQSTLFDVVEIDKINTH